MLSFKRPFFFRGSFSLIYHRGRFAVQPCVKSWTKLKRVIDKLISSWENTQKNSNFTWKSWKQAKTKTDSKFIAFTGRKRCNRIPNETETKSVLHYSIFNGNLQIVFGDFFFRQRISFAESLRDLMFHSNGTAEICERKKQKS